MLVTLLSLLAVALAFWLGYRIGFRRGGGYGFALGQSSAITELTAARQRWGRAQ